MFRIETKRRTRLTAALEMCEVTYHATVRSARGNQSNALFGLMMNVVFIGLFILTLYITMTIMGMKSNQFRGDFVLFLMTGVMSYMTYNKTMRAVYGAEGPTSAMMMHAPMNTIVAIASAALSALYTQMFAVIVVLFIYHVGFKPLEIANPSFALFMMLSAWIFGISTGLVLMAIKPWAPKLAPIMMLIVARVNIFASGKMVVGNGLSFSHLKFFDWNPLFHIIDQMRGAIFLNYSPRNSNVPYIYEVSFALFVLGMMGEFFSRRHVSKSWFAH